MSVKPKHFSEIYQDAQSLAKAISQVTRHELLACGKCNEPIRVLMKNESISNPRLSGGVVKFCTKCGTEMDWSKQEEPEKQCEICNLRHKMDDSFCIHCGRTLKVYGISVKVIERPGSGFE